MAKSLNFAAERIRLRPDALQGQVAVVTGGGRGTGREIARAIAALGANVLIADVSDDGLETEQIIIEDGNTAFFVKTNVSNESDVNLLARKAEQAFGVVDILVNSAAIYPVASMLDMDVALWDRAVAVNLRGPFLTCRTFLPGMVARRHGTIVNVISPDPMPYLSAYVATSQGLAGFTKSLAAEVGNRGIRVIALALGMVDSPGFREAAQDLSSRLGFAVDDFLNASAHHAYETLMPADHAAAATAYLAAMLADSYHGQTVTGYTVLEHAGFIEASPHSSQVHSATPTLPFSHHTAAMQHESALSERFRQIVAETEAEFNRLPAYVRPLAYRLFEEKSGHSLRQWKAIAGSLIELLREAAEPNGTAKAVLHARHPSLGESVSKLICYYSEAPVLMASLTRDTGLLRDVKDFSPQRETSLRFLLSALERI